MRNNLLRLVSSIFFMLCFFSTTAVKVDEFPLEKNLKNPALYIEIPLPSKLDVLMKDGWNDLTDHACRSYLNQKKGEFEYLKREFIETTWREMTWETNHWHVFRNLHSQLQRPILFFQQILKHIQTNSKEVLPFVKELVLFYKQHQRETSRNPQNQELHFNYKNKIYFLRNSIFITNLFHAEMNRDAKKKLDIFQTQWASNLIQSSLFPLLEKALKEESENLDIEKKRRFRSITPFRDAD